MSIDKANATIDGLNQHLTTAKAEYTSAESLSTEYLKIYLKDSAELEGGNYLRLCNELTESFNRLTTLNRLLEEKGGRPFANTYQATVNLPTFDLQSVRQQAHEYGSMKFARFDIQKGREKERERLLKIGVPLL